MASEIVSKKEYEEYVKSQKQNQKNESPTTGYLNNMLAGIEASRDNILGYTTPQMTNTANPVPTVPTVQQNQKNAEDAAAYASYQRMLKYLPQLNKESGYAGLGVSEAAKTEAWNDLQTRLAQIAMYYDQIQDQKNQETNQMALSVVENELANATSPEEYQKMLNLYRGYLSDSDAALLETIGKSDSRKSIYQQYADLAAGYNSQGGVVFDSNGQNKGLKVGDNFRVRGTDGTIYYVESGGEVSDKNILEAAGRHNDGDLFKYGNYLYMVNDGKVYLVQKRKHSKEKSYKDLINLYL